jgi:hypothetical protein
LHIISDGFEDESAIGFKAKVGAGKSHKSCVGESISNEAVSHCEEEDVCFPFFVASKDTYHKHEKGQYCATATDEGGHCKEEVEVAGEYQKEAEEEKGVSELGLGRFYG